MTAVNNDLDPAYADRIAWIERNGSERLKKCVALGIRYYDGIYRDERLRATLGEARWAEKGDVESEIINPSLEALELLEQVRQQYPESELIKLRTAHVREWFSAIRVVVPWAAGKVAYLAVEDDN